MAPSTAKPTGLHRASVACVACRRAKVRCLVSQLRDQCDRCFNNSFECTFRPVRRERASRGRKGASTISSSSPRHFRLCQDDRSAESNLIPFRTNESGTASAPSVDPTSTGDGSAFRRPPIISDRMRQRIIEALTALRGGRGSPFSFVTSGEHPNLLPSETESSESMCAPQASGHQQTEARECSLSLQTILRPLYPSIGTGSRPSEADTPKAPVTMPSYLESMSLGHTITDAVNCGILDRSASLTLFDHFLFEMNAKWEFILDPLTDTHDSVRKRSSFLFAAVLFCGAKFARAAEKDVALTDLFVQSRLCGLARNLAVRTFAQGDRSIETMQAFYLLACWKEPDDGTSHLHCGYAFRILQDLDLNSDHGDSDQLVRRRRTWLALYRQDIQQGLWLMRRTSIASSIEEGIRFLGDPDMWRDMAQVRPFDFVSCCNANLRRFQFKTRSLVKTTSPASLPSLLDLMEAQLAQWRSTWQRELVKSREGVGQCSDSSSRQSLCMPNECRVTRLMALWEQSVRLSIGSEVLQRALLATVGTNARKRDAPRAQPQPGSRGTIEETDRLRRQASQASVSSVYFGLDTSSVMDLLATDICGLRESIEGAFGTLRQILRFPIQDLRHAPDSVSLLGPHAALFLCLLLCLPCCGLLGPSFQHTAVGIVQEVYDHFNSAMKSAQDSLHLHVNFLRSIVELVRPPPTHLRVSSRPSDTNESSIQPTPHEVRLEAAAGNSTGDQGTSAATSNGMQDFVPDYLTEQDIFADDFSAQGIHDIDMQSLANLMDPNDQFGFGFSMRDSDVDPWNSNLDGMV